MPFSPVTDLNWPPGQEHAPTRSSGWGRSSHVHRQTRVRAGDGSPAAAYTSALHSALQRQPARQTLQLLGSIPMHGLHTAHLPGEPTRHRGVSQCTEQQALPHGYPFPHCSQHPGRGQRETRLAYLRRLCPVTDPDRPATVCRRGSWSRTRQHGLRARRLHHRSLPVGLPLGAFPESQGRHQITYTAQSTRQYPIVYPYLRRQAARRQCARPVAARGRCLVRHGLRLYRLQAPVRTSSSIGIFRHSRQVRPAVPPALFSPRGQTDRASVRSNHHADWCPQRPVLPGPASPHQVLRRGNRQTAGLSDQQLHHSGAHRNGALPVPLAGGAVLQMDQATPAHQIVFRDLRECGQDAGLDRRLSLCPSRHHQETTQYPGQPLHNPTDFEPDHFRNNAAGSTTYGR